MSALTWVPTVSNKGKSECWESGHKVHYSPNPKNHPSPKSSPGFVTSPSFRTPQAKDCPFSLTSDPVLSGGILLYLIVFLKFYCSLTICVSALGSAPCSRPSSPIFCSWGLGQGYFSKFKSFFHLHHVVDMYMLGSNHCA